MKITAIVCGRPDQIGEKLARTALKAARDEGAGIELINLMKLNIKPCINCGTCVRVMRDPDFKGTCPLKDDDMAWLDEQMLSSDGLIFVAPMYEATAAGTYRIMCDRIGPSHDVTFMRMTYEARIAAGLDPKIDTRWLRSRAAGIIAHGGSEWSYLGFPTTASPCVSMGMTINDYYQVEWNQDVPGNPEKLARAEQLGRNIAREAGKHPEDRLYHGPEGSCPVCHCNVIRADETGGTAACALCGAVGIPVIREDGKIILHMTEEEKKRSHLYESGRLQHAQDLKHNQIVRQGLDQEAIRKAFEPLKKEIPLSLPDRQG